jgi:hypothetical protein
MRTKHRASRKNSEVGKWEQEGQKAKSRACIVYIAIYCSIAIAILQYIAQYDIAILSIALI